MAARGGHIHLVAVIALLVALISSAAAQQQSAANESGKPVVPVGTTVLIDVAYVEGGHERQKLDLYVPGGRSGPHPLILWIHGGAWRQGGKHAHRIFPLVTSFVADGWAVASINHRYSHQAVFPGQIHDAKAAVRWLRANAAKHRLDPDRFVAWGASSGGHLVALLGTSAGVRELGDNDDRSSRIQAVIDFFGPTDFLQMDARRLPDGVVRSNEPTSPESQLVGGLITENEAAVRRANPIAYITPDDPPFLIVHGDRDLSVPHHQSLILAGALKNARVPNVFRTVAGAGHGDDVFRAAPLREWVSEFLNINVKGPQRRTEP